MSDNLDTALKNARPHFEQYFEPLQKTIDHLWTTFAYDSMKDARSATILISGVNGQAGATTVACCTVIGLAHHLKMPTILVETSAGKGEINRLFGLSSGPGLTEVLEGEAELTEAVKDTGFPNLFVLPFGEPQPAGLSTVALRELFDQLSQRYRYVVLDTPPLLENPITRVILRHVDKAMLVLEAQKTSEENSQHAIAIIRDSGVELVGAVVNNYTPEAPGWLLPSKWH